MIERLLTKIIVVSVLLVVVVMMVCPWGAAEAYSGIAKAGCQDECGGVQIPFPFGIGDGCYHIINQIDFARDAYKIVCHNTTNNPKPLLPILGNREVLSINLQDQSLRVSSWVAYECYNTGKSVPSTIPNVKYGPDINYAVPIWMSIIRNEFVSIGCDTTASLWDADAVSGDTARCTTSCMDTSYAMDGECDSDLGCCENLIGTYMTQPSLHVSSSFNRSNNDFEAKSLCGYAYVAEVGWYNFSATNLTASAIDCYNFRVPLVYDWFLDRCSEAKADGYDSVKAMCSSNSMFECGEIVGPLFYYEFLTCQCLEGYSGNPYLPHGCQDMNECIEERMNNCQKREYCVNKEGGYDCRCPPEYLGDGTTASPCIPVPIPSDTKLILGVSIGISSMIGFITLWLVQVGQKEKRNQRKGTQLQEKWWFAFTTRNDYK